MRTHHSEDSHQVYRHRVLLHPLCNQLHQQHEHVVDPLVNLCAPLVYCTACQQLWVVSRWTDGRRVNENVCQLIRYLHSYLELGLCAAHLLKGLWHAAIHKPLAVLVGFGKA